MMENGSQGYTLQESQYWTMHHQVATTAPDGTEIYVDEGICTLLETLWDQGYTTTFSCSGGPPTNGVKASRSISQQGYIYFETEVMAKTFMDAVAVLLPRLNYPYYLETSGGLQGKVVRFDESMIPLFIKALKRLEAEN